MFRRHYNLILMAIWVAIGLCLVAPDLILPDQIRQQVRAPGGSLAGVLAFTFAAYNLVRWWSYQSLRRGRPTAAVNPLMVRKHEADEGRYEPNPELDFLKVPGADKPGRPPEPSSNGDHKA